MDWIKFVKLHADAQAPTQGHHNDAGWDMYCVESSWVQKGEEVEVPLGIAIELPEGLWARITGRSSTSKKLGLHVVEGIIDTGYRGQLFARVHNPGQDRAFIQAGTRIAQLIIHDVIKVTFQQAEKLAESERGTGGFGSTGK